MPTVPGVEYTPIAFADWGSLWSTPDETHWIALSAQDAVYILFTDNEQDAHDAYAATPDTTNLTPYPIVAWAGTLDPVPTSCYLLGGDNDWVIANLPDPGAKYFHRTSSATDAADTYAAITDGWPFLATA